MADDVAACLSAAKASAADVLPVPPLAIETGVDNEFAEQGFAGFETISWQAVLAPAGTPKPIIERVSRELVRIIKSDGMRLRMLGQYFSAAGTAPEALAGMMKSERERWAQVIKAAGVQAE